MNKHLALLALAGSLALLAAQDQAATQGDTPALKLEAKIPIGNVSGRIDHMAIDLSRQRLFIAELGNNTVGIVDLNSRSVIRTIDGLKEPQGVAYLPSKDTEVFYEKEFGKSETVSGLVGMIWQVREDLSFDAGVRHALTNGHPVNELRAGMTVGFSVPSLSRSKAR